MKLKIEMGLLYIEMVINMKEIYKLPPNKCIRKFYLVLINKEIYYYKDEIENEFLGMHNLSGCFINENTDLITENNGIKYYSFEIIFNNKAKVRTYYSPSQEIIKQLIEHIKKGFGYLINKITI